MVRPRPPAVAHVPLALGAIILLTLGLAGAVAAAEDDASAVAFFEAKVRPILVERCQSCHGPSKAKGGLRLDSRASLLRGGEGGPAVVPGDPDASRLVAAVRYGDDLQMPPKSKLPDAEVATLARWVETGATWPVAPPSAGAGGSGPAARKFDLAERARHWSLQPVRAVEPPRITDPAWSANPIDRFLRARLDAAGVAPAPPADRATLIRRLTFDLTGLPPTPAEVAAFVVDDAADADDRLVDRLLASPHYGERWGRHWLDLVRFAETSGHEFDYNIPEAWRYRDYVVRAFNADLPYDRFIVEQVAGDLLPEPRRDPSTGLDESTLGTAFFRLHEGVHSPVDLREDAATRLDNQVDVLGKAFLGLTVACARCHDHKFDAITTRDYYALTGYLASSRHALAFLDPPARRGPSLTELRAIRAEVADRLAVERTTAEAATPTADPAVFEGFDGPGYQGWSVAGDAFGTGPTDDRAWRLVGERWVQVPPGVAHSGLVAGRLRGVIRSRTFPITTRSIHLLAAGRGGRINVVVDGFPVIRAPIYGDLVRPVDHGDAFKWVTIDVGPWVGHPAYLEVDDGATVDYTGSVGVVTDARGWIAVDEIRLGDGPPPPVPDRPRVEVATTDPRLAGFEARVARYRAVEAALPDPALGPALVDGTGADARVLIRGSTRNPGDVVPRRFLEVFAGPDDSALAPATGSGRLDLARRIASPANPLTARVLVNRVWHHHFGRGIVASVDDFGVMGREPTHPELLDFLADQFVRSGWSIKALHRLIVRSAAYRMGSRPDPDGDARDPGNALWHRREVRRLEAEAIRDAILAVSGRLDPTIGGPGVPPHLTPFMDGRGRPGKSGPLDGNGRRSIYLTVRRNFLNPMLLAFDFPTPSSSMGRRNVSNVPAQALTMLNDPFVAEQARRWADRVRADPATSPDASITAMYQAAFARDPEPAEQADARAFVADAPDPKHAWADLAHALFNVKEFIAIP